ncbi:hypothetical protein LPJ59_006164, partial [Coemansia sp. RSA 2399]
MAAATSKSLLTNDASPLSPLEERVFRKELAEQRDTGYSVLNDESVLKMCDDDVEQAALADAAAADTVSAATALHGLAAHGWRIDSVIDKYGKRLARMVVQRKAAPDSSEVSFQPYQSASTSHAATTHSIRNPLHLLQGKHSMSNSPYMSSGAQHTYSSSPKAGYAELGANDATSNTPTPQLGRTHTHGPWNGTGYISKKPTSGRAEPYTRSHARRKQGSSLDSATA